MRTGNITILRSDSLRKQKNTSLSHKPNGTYRSKIKNDKTFNGDYKSSLLAVFILIKILLKCHCDTTPRY